MRNRRAWRTAGGAVAVALCLARAQTPPAFDVASVKPTQHGRGADGWSHSSVDSPSPGNFVATNATLNDCLRWAYDMKEYQISGPAWLATAAASFDIAAKAPPGTPRDRIRLMVQSLLAERFKLAAHRETRMLPAYSLVVGKGGPKLKAATPGVETSAYSERGRSIILRSISMAGFAEALSRHMSQVVVDQTGIKGDFDITLEYVTDDEATTIFAAIQQKLGLRLESVKRPVEVLVVDHAEKSPTEN